MAILPASAEVLVNPLVSGEVFTGKPDAAYWVGVVASQGEVINEEVFEGLLKLRGNVYIHELGFLDEEHLDGDGLERDLYDDRSTHFAVVQNDDAFASGARVVGSLRLIKKDDEEQEYPIERYFPEIFDMPIGTDSAEVSRFIARFPEDPHFMQHMISLALIRAAALHGEAEEIPEYYCIIEKPLLRLLEKIGIPMEVLGDPKDVPEQGGILYPVRIDTPNVVKSVTADKSGTLSLKPFFEHEAESLGLGYYDASMIGEAE